LKISKDSTARFEFDRSFHQQGKVQEKVCERDFVPLLGVADTANFGIDPQGQYRRYTETDTFKSMHLNLHVLS